MVALHTVSPPSTVSVALVRFGLYPIALFGPFLSPNFHFCRLLLGMGTCIGTCIGTREAWKRCVLLVLIVPPQRPSQRM